MSVTDKGATLPPSETEVVMEKGNKLDERQLAQVSGGSIRGARLQIIVTPSDPQEQDGTDQVA